MKSGRWAAGHFIEAAVEFDAALGIDNGLQANDAVQPPVGVVNGLDEAALFEGFGVVEAGVVVEALLVGGGVIVIKEDAVAAEAVFDGVAGGDGFSCG